MNKYVYVIFTILPLNLMASESILYDNKIHTDNVDSLCIKDKSIISASFDGSIKKTTGNDSKIIGKHKDWVRKVICTDSDIISASNDGTITVWNNFEKISSVQAHSWWVTDIALANDKIISISLDETVKVWSYPKLKLLYSHKIYGSNKHYSVVVNNNMAFIGSSRGSMFVLDLKEFDVPNKILIDRDEYSVMLSSTQSYKYIFFGTSDGFLIKVTASAPHIVFKRKISDSSLKAIVQHKGFLYVGDSNGVMRKVNIEDLKVSNVINQFPQAIRALTINNDTIYAGYDKGYIRLFTDLINASDVK